MKLRYCELKKLFNNRMPWLLLAVNVWLLLGEIPAEKVASEKQLSEFMEIYKADTKRILF